MSATPPTKFHDPHLQLDKPPRRPHRHHRREIAHKLCTSPRRMRDRGEHSIDVLLVLVQIPSYRPCVSSSAQPRVHPMPFARTNPNTKPSDPSSWMCMPKAACAVRPFTTFVRAEQAPAPRRVALADRHGMVEQPNVTRLRGSQDVGRNNVGGVKGR